MVCADSQYLQLQTSAARWVTDEVLNVSERRFVCMWYCFQMLWCFLVIVLIVGRLSALAVEILIVDSIIHSILLALDI